MNDNFSSVITLPADKSRIMVQAAIGSQAIGALSGEPINATDPGPVILSISVPNGDSLGVMFTDLTFVAAVRDALDRAIKVADTRYYTLDKPRKP